MAFAAITTRLAGASTANHGRVTTSSRRAKAAQVNACGGLSRSKNRKLVEAGLQRGKRDTVG